MIQWQIFKLLSMGLFLREGKNRILEFTEVVGQRHELP